MSSFITFYLLFSKKILNVYGRFGCMQRSQRSEEDARSPETGVTDDYGYWESNLGPLEEQPMLLTAEPSLRPSSYLWNQSVTELGVH